MGRERPADHLPHDVLTRPDFRAACADRDLGRIFRLAKQWGGVGFTASHLARRCELTVSRVQDYISGQMQAQRVEVFERVADGLHIPGAMLDLAPRSWEGPAGASAGDVDPAPQVTATEDRDSTVLRRDFVKLGGGIAATALAGQVRGVPSRSVGNRVGASTVDALRANMARLRPLDDHMGGADTFRLYLAEVDRMSGLLKRGSFTDVTRQELLTLFAEGAQQAGWAAFDAGWHGEAKLLYDRSFGAAREAGNAALAGNALALRSYQLLSTGPAAVELTDKSCAIAAMDVHPAVKSLLFQRGAWTYAVAGDMEKTARALGLAESALSAPNGEPAPDWAVWAHNPTELRIMAGRGWAELHKPLRAVPALEDAMADYDDSHARDKSLYLSWLADAYLDAGELGEATAVTDHALTLAANVASERPQQRLNAVLDRFQGHESASGVSDLLARRPLNPVQVRS